MISIVLPTYNESVSIGELLGEIRQVLASQEYEVIVADDGSPDGTADLVEGLGDERVRVIRRSGPRGLAVSIRDGLMETRGERIVVMDSDFNHQVSYLPILLENLKHYDCVMASRFLYGGGMQEAWRNSASWIFNLFIRIMTGGSVTDCLYGYFAIHRAKLFECDFGQVFWGYGDYCIRLFYYLQKKRVSLLQIPAQNGRRRSGQGNRRFFWVLWKYTREVVLLTMKERFGFGKH
jgi:dolichol-phosphate mannosyltransferase